MKRRTSVLCLVAILASLTLMVVISGNAIFASTTELSTAVDAVQAETSGIESYDILLKARQFTPTPGVHEGVTALQASLTPSMHMLVQLWHIPNEAETQSLADAGIRLFAYIPNNSWFATVQHKALEHVEELSLVRWMGPILREDKLAPEIVTGQIGSWARAANDHLLLLVQLFPDVEADTVLPLLTELDCRIVDLSYNLNLVVLDIPHAIVGRLADTDMVQWIEPVPPKGQPKNDGSRQSTHVEQLQGAPYSLTGSGITAMVYDGGAVDGAHDDFGNRVVFTETVSVNDHSTHVAGTLGGNGTLSATRGGTDRQWQGIAPGVTIVSMDYRQVGDPEWLNPGNLYDEYRAAINNRGVDLANNSWGDFCSVDGGNTIRSGYQLTARTMDRIVRGEGIDRGIPLIWATGNERGPRWGCGTNPGGFANYRTQDPMQEAKNIISVGAVNSDDSSMTTFSNWGPVADGRLKPEIVAPGCERETIRDDSIYTRTIWSTLPGDRYGGMCGTSMAAPVVSGISALLIEQYRATYGHADPWPATVKTLLAHSAHDLDDDTSWYNPGPDYASGYGLVDAKAAVDLVRAQALRQDTISANHEADLFHVWVLTGTAQIKATLAWDDPAAAANANPALVNDLDLILWSPDTTYYSWILDPASPAADAGRGKDSINNLEQVLVSNPTPGEWTIVVTGTRVALGPQSYALVSESLFDIVEPAAGHQVYAGPVSAPHKVVIATTKPRDDLTFDQFQVTVGGRTASILTFYEGSDSYVLEILPAMPSANGSYDLSVMVPAASAWSVKRDAVLFAETANVDVDLVIDRSGSMGVDKMNAAKDAAKQFVDLMQIGDMIGVVSFDDVVETNFPLTTIAPSSPAPPLFSDDMESGTARWTADAPWGLTTATSHSPTHAWTDSPGGNYNNNANFSLRTVTPINISSAIATPVLGLWQRYELESGYDRGYIEASTNGGSSWIAWTYVTGSNPTWHRIEQDLTAYKGRDLLIRFRLATDSSVTHDGWYIDDVTIGQSSTDTKTLARSAIDALYSRGTTSIGGGLQRGQDQLSSRGNVNHPWAIVLLSDGLENTPPSVANVLPTIKASKTVVHTVGLGSDADQALMLDIASQTGGTYNFAPTAEELSGIYNTIAGAVANRQTLFTATGVAQQGVTDQKDVVIDSTVSDATFSVSWSNSSSTIGLTLRKPNGQIIDPAVAGGDPNVEYVAGSTYCYYRIKTPTLVAGVWQMRITGGSVSAAEDKGIIATPTGEPYKVRVTGDTSLTMRFYLGRSYYLTTEPVNLIVTLSDEQPVRGATVTVAVQAPPQTTLAQRAAIERSDETGTTFPSAEEVRVNPFNVLPTATVTLYDDGGHGDGAANDGVYAGIFGATFREGTYVFSAEAAGTSTRREAFVRQAVLSTHIAQHPTARTYRTFVALATNRYSSTGSPTWHPSTGLTGRAVYDLSSANASCATLFAGTDAGAFHSTDGGHNWSPLTVTSLQADVQSQPFDELANPTGNLTPAVAVCPANHSVVYLTRWGEGVYRSTNSGSSWQPRSGGLTDPWVYDLTVDPRNCNTVYAGTNSSGVFKTTDGGGSWQARNGGLGNLSVRSLAIAPGAADRLYAGTTNGVFRSDNGAGAWDTTGALPGATVWALAVPADNSDTIYAGLDGHGVYKSANRGQAWQARNAGLGNVKVRALVIDPTDPQTLYAGRDDGGGIYRSFDATGSWNAFNDGLTSRNVKSLWLDGGNCHILHTGTTNGHWYFR